MSKKIVKELLTKWTYKVDTKQLAATAKLIKGMKGGFTDVRKASVAFGKGEFKRISKIRKGWQGLNKQVTGYRKNLSQMPRGTGGGGRGSGGGGRGSRGGGRGGVGGMNSAAFLAGRMAGNSALTSALLGGPLLAGGFAAAGAIKAAGNRESAEVSFKSLLGGSGEKATKLLDDLSEFAKKTPFALGQLRELAKQTLGGGFAQDDIIPLLKKLGNVTQGDNVKLNRMLTNMVEIKNIGKAFTRDIRQFGRAGIPIFAELKKNLKVSGEELDKLITTGKVGFKDVNNALRTMTTGSGLFTGNMEAQMNTFLGRMNNLGDVIVSVGEKVGKPFLKPFTAAIKFASDEIMPFVTNLGTVVTTVSKLVAVIPGIKGWGIALAGALVLVGVALFPLTSGFLAILAVMDDIGVYLRGGKSVIGLIIDSLGGGARGQADNILVPKEGDSTGRKVMRGIARGFLGPIISGALDGTGKYLLEQGGKGLDYIAPYTNFLGASNDNRVSNQSLAVNQSFHLGSGQNLESVMGAANDSTLDLQSRQAKPVFVA